MKQTLQSILTASDAALFPDISKSCSQNSVLCITESDVFRCNEEIAVFLQDPDFQNRLCKQDFVDVLFVLKGNCTCKFYKTDLTISPESVFLSRHSFCMIPHQVIHSFSPDHGCQILHIFFKLDSLRSHYSDLISANNALLLFFPICCINHITGIIFIFQSPTQISWILCWLKCTKNSIVNRFIIKICFIIHPVRFLPLWSGSYSARSLFRLPIHFDWCVMIRFILISVIIIQ